MMDGMRLARRRMPTQYKVCGVCLVIGWVELLIEEGIPRMTVHKLMGDAPRWKRRPNEADDGTMANAYDMHVIYYRCSHDSEVQMLLD